MKFRNNNRFQTLNDDFLNWSQNLIISFIKSLWIYLIPFFIGLIFEMIRHLTIIIIFFHGIFFRCNFYWSEIELLLRFFEYISFILKALSLNNCNCLYVLHCTMLSCVLTFLFLLFLYKIFVDMYKYPWLFPL